MNRKFTAWKKSRKFGDIFCWRQRLKLDDNIFKRCHSLSRPAPDDELPIVIEDNPSRDFFFPLTAAEVVQALQALPKKDYSQITHIWLRRLKKTEYEVGNIPQAEFICGSGVRLIVLYPTPKDMVVKLGNKKPSRRRMNELGKWCSDISIKNGVWSAKWSLNELRGYYINSLLYHEVGHHIDWYYRQWSKANSKKLEEFADQYAMQKTATATYVLNRLNNQANNEST